MTRTTTRTGRALTVAIGLALVASGCGGSDKKADETTTTAASSSSAATTPTTVFQETSTTTTEPTTTTVPKPTSVEIHPMFFRNSNPPSGGVGKEVVSVAPSSDGSVRLDFSEDEVSGLGDQSRAASWNAVVVATLLTGSELSGAYRFEITGPIDGPSAGALKTVAVLSLLEGDTLGTDITMTGTINPDGTVGPVGGIPQKVQGAADAGFKRILIPIGQRNSTDKATGQPVDVVALGDRLGVKITEVGSVYEAYKAFTGKDLPQIPASSGGDRLDETAYARLKAKADNEFTEFQSAAGQFTSLDPTIQGWLADLAGQASDVANQASSLQSQGLQAGAFAKAAQASALATAAVRSGQLLQVLLTQGIDPFLSQVDSSMALQGKVYAFFDEMTTYTPKTLSDVSALTFAYANGFDALAASQFASNQINNIVAQIQQGYVTVEEALPQMLLPVVYAEFAAAVVDYARVGLDVGRDLGGPEITSTIDLQKVADFFRKASDANFSAFRTTVVKDQGNSIGASEEAALSLFANLDLDVALSAAERNTLDGLTQYIGEGKPNAAYAALGFAIGNFSRNATLVYKYYANGNVAVQDGQITLLGVRSEAAMTESLELGKAQLQNAIGLLRDKGAEPSLEVATLQSANVDREGTIDDKFSALGQYWSGFISTRVLAYLGGFPTEGLGKSN